MVMDRFKSSESSSWPLHPQKLNRKKQRNILRTMIKVYVWTFDTCTIITTYFGHDKKRSATKKQRQYERFRRHTVRYAWLLHRTTIFFMLNVYIIITLQIICAHYSSRVDVADLHTEIESPIESIFIKEKMKFNIYCHLHPM